MEGTDAETLASGAVVAVADVIVRSCLFDDVVVAFGRLAVLAAAGFLAWFVVTAFVFCIKFYQSRF